MLWFLAHLVDGHILIAGRKVNIPSFQVSVGDTISVAEKSRKVTTVIQALDLIGSRGVPTWLELDSPNFAGKVLTLPKRDDVNLPVQERMIVELYSK